MKDKTWKNDLILIVVLLFSALILLTVLMIKRDKGTMVKVEADGKTVGCYSLSEDGEYTLNNGSNTLIIKGGFASMAYADCPDKICVKQGKINSEGQTIVCLPNRIVVTIIQNGGGVDLVL